MLVCFVLDTSASMNQPTGPGLTLLDCAKSAIDHFIKVRARDASSKGDMYLLLTCHADPSLALKALDRHPFNAFTAMLKTVVARDMSCLGSALRQGLNVLHMQRLVSGADNYGQGFVPNPSEPALLLLLTDGLEMTNATLDGIADGFVLPRTATIGSELTEQPYRWDQRVFSVLLRIPALGLDGGPAPSLPAGAGATHTEVMRDDHPVAAMCELTGGRCYGTSSLRALFQCVEMIATTKTAATEVVCFERSSVNAAELPPLSDNMRAACQHRGITSRAPSATWPIPEAFKPDAGVAALPPRNAHPVITYVAQHTDVSIPQGFPVDVYEVESCPITGFLLTASDVAPESVCWPVYVHNSSGDNTMGHAFGFLRLKRGASVVCLHVLPYNYPALFRLVDRLLSGAPGQRPSPSLRWRQDFEAYLATVPAYYYPGLKNAFKQLQLPSQLIVDSRDGVLSITVAAYLKRLQQAAHKEVERLQAATAQLLHETAPALAVAIFGKQRDERLAFANASGSEAPPKFRDPFAVPRNKLLESAAQVSAGLRTLNRRSNPNAPIPKAPAPSVPSRVAAGAKSFSVPIAIMGDYQDAAAKKAPLRDPTLDDEERIRQSRFAFGNPFFRDRQKGAAAGLGAPGFTGLAVDEAAGEADINFGGGELPVVPRSPHSALRARRRGTPGPHQAVGPPPRPDTPPPVALQVPQVIVEDAAAADARWAEMLKQRKAPLRKRPADATKAVQAQAMAAPPPPAAASGAPVVARPGDVASSAVDTLAPPAKRGRHTLLSAQDVEVLLESLRLLRRHCSGLMDKASELATALESAGEVVGSSVWAQGVKQRAEMEGRRGMIFPAAPA